MVVIPAMLSTATKTPALTGGGSTRGSHQLSAASKCERMYALRYIKRLRVANEPPWRLIGTLMHSALAYHYAERCDRKPDWFQRLKAQGQSLEDVVRLEGAQRPQDVDLVLDELLPAYRRYWQSEALQPLFVEEEFQATIGELDPGPDRRWPELDDEVVTCRTDLVGLINRRPWIIDHKCTSAGGQQYLPQWRPDSGEYRLSLQIMVNMAILSLRLPELGYEPPAGFLMNRIKRKHPFDFARDPAGTSPLALAEVGRHLRAMVKREVDVREAVAAGIKPSANYDACFTRWGPCDYANICASSTEAERNRFMNQLIRA